MKITSQNHDCNLIWTLSLLACINKYLNRLVQKQVDYFMGTPRELWWRQAPRQWPSSENVSTIISYCSPLLYTTASAALLKLYFYHIMTIGKQKTSNFDLWYVVYDQTMPIYTSGLPLIIVYDDDYDLSCTCFKHHHSSTISLVLLLCLKLKLIFMFLWYT